MDVTVNGRRMEISDELRRLSVDKVGRLGRIVAMDRAEVRFSQEANSRIPNQVRCEVTLEGHGHHVRSKVADADGFSAIDKAITKVEAQLKRLKSRLQRRGNDSLRTAPTAEGLVGDESVTVDAESHAGGPKIVKSKRFAMMPMTPEEAVGRMDLLGHGFFFFTSSDTHRAAVVYRRDDGDVGLIDEAD